MKRSGIVRSFLAVIIATAGCDSSGASDNAFPVANWRMSPTPATHIGREGEPGHELDRVYGGILRPDGSLVIGNSGTAELRFFDASGALKHTAGRRGAGPGEFGGINWLAPLGADSLIAYDMRNQRFSVWTALGAFARDFRAPPGPGPLHPVGVLGDGSILVARTTRLDPRANAGLVRDTMDAVRISRTGQPIGTVGRFPGADWLLLADPPRSMRPPIGRAGHLAALGENTAYASSESGTITIYDPSGKRVREIHVGGAERALTRAEVTESLASIHEAVDKRALERHYANGSHRAPIISDVRADREGRLWVQLFPPAGSDSATWVVIKGDGQRLGHLRTSRDDIPLDVTDRWMLVREIDEDGLHRVTVRGVLR